MSWEATWTMIGVLAAIGVALAPWMWRMAENTGQTNERMGVLVDDLREIKEDVKHQFATLWQKHDSHSERLDKHESRLNEHEVRLHKVERAE